MKTRNFKTMRKSIFIGIGVFCLGLLVIKNLEAAGDVQQFICKAPAGQGTIAVWEQGRGAINIPPNGVIEISAGKTVLFYSTGKPGYEPDGFNIDGQIRPNTFFKYKVTPRNVGAPISVAAIFKSVHDAVAPYVKILSPAKGSVTVTGNNPKITISGKAESDSGSIKGNRVKIYKNDTLISRATIDANRTWTFQNLTLDEGDNVFLVKAVDDAWRVGMDMLLVHYLKTDVDINKEKAVILIDKRLYDEDGIEERLGEYISLSERYVGGDYKILLDYDNYIDDWSADEVCDYVYGLKNDYPLLEGVLFIGNIKLPSFSFYPSPIGDPSRLIAHKYEDLDIILRKENDAAQGDYDYMAKGENPYPELWTAYIPVGYAGDDSDNEYSDFAKQVLGFLKKAIAQYKGKEEDKKLYFVSNGFLDLKGVTMEYGLNGVDFYSVNDTGYPLYHLIRPMPEAGIFYKRAAIEAFSSFDEFSRYYRRFTQMGTGWQKDDIFKGHLKDKNYAMILTRAPSKEDLSILTTTQAKAFTGGGLILLAEGNRVAGFKQYNSDSFVDTSTMPDDNILCGFVYGKSNVLAALGTSFNRLKPSGHNQLAAFAAQGDYIGLSHFFRKCYQYHRSKDDPDTLGKSTQELLIGNPFLVLGQQPPPPPPPKLPDLAAIDIKFYKPSTDIEIALGDLKIGERVTCKAILKNQGNVSTGRGFNVEWKLNGLRVGYGSHIALGAGEISNDNVYYYDWTPVVGTHTFIFTADCDYHIEESNEDNNTVRKTVIISEVPLPNLVLLDIDWTPTNINIDTRVSFTVIVKNTGPGRSEPTTDLRFGIIRGGVIGPPFIEKTYPDVIPELNSGESITIQIEDKWDACEYGQISVQAVANYPNTPTAAKVKESDYTDNSRVEYFNVNKPDLIVTDIIWDPDSVVVGNDVQFSVKVKNQGTSRTLFGFPLQFIAGYGSASPWIQSVDVPALDPNQESGPIPVTLKWHAASAGSYVIKAHADWNGHYGIIPETDENNNIRQETLTVSGLPDLKVEDISWNRTNITVGDEIELTVKVTNIGAGKSEPETDLKFGIARSWMPNPPLMDMLYADAIPVLDPGASVTITIEDKWTAGESGQMAVQAVANWPNTPAQAKVKESDYTNNSRVEYFEVDELPKADLVVTDISWIPATILEGDKVTFKIEIKNQGQADAQVNHLLIYVDDGSPTPWDQSVNVPRLTANGGSATIAITTPWPAAVKGDYLVRARVDSNDEVLESNEENNTRDENLTVYPAPDLIVEDIIWAPSSIKQDDQVTFQVKVKNIGEGEARENKLYIKLYTEPNRKYGNGIAFESTVDVPVLGGNGGSAIISIPNKWSAFPALHNRSFHYRISAHVNFLNTIAESNKDNNTRVEEFFVEPKLVNADATGVWDLHLNEHIKPDGTVIFAGWAYDRNLAYDPSTVRIYIDGRRILEVVANKLRVDVPTNVDDPYVYGDFHGFSATTHLDPGSYTVHVKAVDVPSGREINLWHSPTKITVGDNRWPDLIIPSIEFLDETGTSGNTFSVNKKIICKVTVKNIGLADAGVSKLKINLLNPSLTWHKDIGVLAPGASQVEQIEWTPTSVGTYTFVSYADIDDRVAESYEGNNSWTQSLTVVDVTNSAQFISQSVPTEMIVGQSYPVSVTMKNIGRTTWTKAGGYRLGSQKLQDNTTWGLGRVDLGDGDSIAPNQTKTFTFTVTAPQTPEHYYFKWRMLKERVEWFGQNSVEVRIRVTEPAIIVPTAPTNLTITTLSTNQLRLNWRDNSDNESGSGFKIERRVGSSGSFSQIATAGANIVTYTDSGLSADTTYNYRVCAYNAGGNSSYSNVASGTTASVPPPPSKPDLVVTDIKFYKPQTNIETIPQAGQLVTCKAILRNQGSVSTGRGFNVKWHLDGTQIGYGSHTALAAGATSNGNVSYDWIPTAGSHTLKFTADYGNRISESNENNNVFSRSVTVVDNRKPDLVVTDIKFYKPQTNIETIPQAGQLVTCKAILKNQGDASTGVFNVKWYLDSSQVGLGSHKSLAPGETSNDNVRFDWTPTVGRHGFYFAADCYRQVSESNEENNNFSKSVTVADNRKPDLVVTGIKFYNSSGQEVTDLIAGQKVTCKAILRNQGSVSTGRGFNVKWHLDGTQVGYGSHTALAAGATSDGNVRYDWMIPTAGSHTLKFTADCDNHISESNEDNNLYAI